MRIKKGVDYCFTQNFETLSYVELEDQSYHWLSFSSYTGHNSYTQKQMQDMYDKGIIDTAAKLEEVARNLYINANKIFKNKSKGLLKKYVVVTTALGEEFLGILIDVDFNSKTYTLKDAILIFADNIPVSTTMAELPIVFVDSLNKMTLNDKKEWEKLKKYNSDPEFDDEIELMKSDTQFYDEEENPRLGKLDFKTIKEKRRPRKSKPNRNDIKSLPKTYDPKLVNAEINPKQLADKLKIALEKKDKPDAITILLSGVPGVGKSMAVAYVAKQLKMPVHAHKISDIMDKWVGATERAIAKAFKDAAKSNALLLFDEIDSISGNRGENESKHHISTVNTLLQALDDFKGLAIFTTNSIDRMDTAIKRRILLEIEMKNLTSHQADEMASLFFPRRKIKNLEDDCYAPSDFSKTKDGFLFVENKQINKQFILKKLKAAADTRNGISSANRHKIPIGF